MRKKKAIKQSPRYNKAIDYAEKRAPIASEMQKILLSMTRGTRLTHTSNDFGDVLKQFAQNAPRRK